MLILAYVVTKFGLYALYILFGILIYHICPKKRPKNYPPGPPSFGVLGNFSSFLLTSRIDGPDKLIKLCDTYGKVMAFDFGSKPCIVISDINVVKEAFNNEKVCGRPPSDFCQLYQDERVRGMVFASGREWKDIRRFTMSQLKTFGLGKSSVEPMLLAEAEELVGALRAEKGRPFKTHGFFDVSVFNVLWCMIAGERHPLKDPQVEEIGDTYSRFNESYVFVPLLFAYPLLSKFLIPFSKEVKFLGGRYLKFLNNYVKRRKEKFQPGQINDFTDAFLDKIHNTTDTSSIFYGTRGSEELTGIIRDLHLAGMETTSSTISWLFLYLAIHPDVQKKLQAQIDTVLEGRTPTLDDKAKLPYVDAVINETLRKAVIAFMGIMHYTTEDTVIAGYDIPKDTMVVSNTYAIHHSVEIWGDPYAFRPERFLNEDETKLVKHEAFIPFGTGKRICPGEQMSRDELFMFVTVIFSKLSVTWNPNEPKPTMKTKAAFSLKPLPHSLIISERDSHNHSHHC